MNVSSDRDVSFREFHGPAGRIYADDRSPDFGPSRDMSEVRNPDGRVDIAVETDQRRALPGLVSERFTEAAAVDGVRRVDVRLTADRAVQESRSRFGGCVRGRVGVAAFHSPVRYPCPILSHPLFTLPFMNVSSDRDVYASAGAFAASAGGIYADDWSSEYGPSRDASEVRYLAGQVDAAVNPDHWRAMSGSAAGGYEMSEGAEASPPQTGASSASGGDQQPGERNRDDRNRRQREGGERPVPGLGRLPTGRPGQRSGRPSRHSLRGFGLRCGGGRRTTSASFGGCVRGRVGAAAFHSSVRYPYLGLSHPLFTMPVMNVSADLDVSAGTFASAGRIYADDRSTGYGPLLDAPEARNQAGRVGAAVKPDHWRAMSGSATCRFRERAAADGARRVDARLTLMERFKNLIPGLAVAFGAGSARRRLTRLSGTPIWVCHTPCLLCPL